jgi:hypothetical protein
MKRKVTTQSLDEMARTMRVIPMSELIDITGGSTITYWTTLNELTGYLSSQVMSPDYIEVAFYEFSDGTYAAYIPDTASNTSSTVTTFLQEKSDGWYFDGKRVVAEGHTHSNSPTPSDDDNANQFSGVSSYIYYDGTYYNIPANSD